MGRERGARRGVERAKNRKEFGCPCPVFGQGEDGMNEINSLGEGGIDFLGVRWGTGAGGHLHVSYKK
jgi:hypothetical protein